MHGPLLPRPAFWAEAARQKSTRYTLLGEILVFFLVYFLASIAQVILMAIPASLWMVTSQGDLLLRLSQMESLEGMMDLIADSLPKWLVYLSVFTCTAYAAAALLYCRRFEKRSVASMGLRRDRLLKELGLGTVLGLLLTAAVTGVGMVAGGYRYTGLLPQTRQSLLFLLLALLGCLVRGFSFELMFRGYLAPSLGSRLPVAFAVGFSSLICSTFTAGFSSLGPMGMLNSLLLSALLCVWVMKRDSLWAACGIHAMWEFGLSFLFGFVPERIEGDLYLLEITTAQSQSTLTGGLYGPEASICATVVLLAALAAALALPARNPASADPKPSTEESGPEVS